MTTNEQRQLGRAKNAILAFLERRISVPKIYIDAVWDGHPVDVLAIDRDGVGDVHAVLLLPTHHSYDPQTEMLKLSTESVLEITSGMERLIQQLQEIPAQYKYVAAVDVSGRKGSPLPGLPHPIVDKSFAPDGIGRIGFMTIEFRADGEAEASTLFKPERFRAKIAKLADDYVQQHEPDWQVRA
jgi:hypothetical protein